MAKRSSFFLHQGSFVETFVTRSNLTKATPPFIRTISLNIVRNEAVEPFLSHSKDIASYFGIDIEVFYSDYSDLPHIPKGQCDLLLVWLNWDRYLPEGIRPLLSHLSLEIGSSNSMRCLVVEPSNVNAEKKSEILRLPGAEKLPWLCIPPLPVLSFWRNSGYSKEEVKYVTDFVGVNLSQQASRLECRAIIVDFDNTLYPGIFAEGYNYVSEEDKPYLLFRKYLKKLSDEGVVIVGATKNNLRDVDSIIHSSILNPLAVNDFVFIQSGWTSKVDTITKVISILNLSAGNIIFIDDNIRELAEVSEVHPDLLCLNGTNPSQILGLLQRHIVFNVDTSNDAVIQRREDLRVRSKRIEDLKDGLDSTTFHSKYNTTIHSRQASIPADYERAISLFQKTNQFNFTLARLSEAEFQSIDTPYRIIVSNLKDDLSDSGTIAAMALLEHSGELEIRELCISCRALGREVEKYVVISMLSEVPGFRDGMPIFCNFVDQDRNQVAKIFLEEYFYFSGKWYLDSKKLYQRTRKNQQILK